jgi:hypothetical protein
MPDLNAHISRKQNSSQGYARARGFRARAELRTPAGLAGAHDRSTNALIRRYRARRKN